MGGRNGDEVRPVVAIQNPLPGARVEGSPGGLTLYVFGSATDAAGISEVQYQILHAGTLSPPATANGGSAWIFPLVLQPGDVGEHTIFVRTIDVNGNDSDLVSRTFTFVAGE